MRMFQGFFSQMKNRFIYEERGEKKLSAFKAIQISHVKEKMVGIIQI